VVDVQHAMKFVHEESEEEHESSSITYEVGAKFQVVVEIAHMELEDEFEIMFNCIYYTKE